MERHIGLWKKENEENSAVAELVIDGNNIEFYIRDSGSIQGCSYISNDSDCKLKAFTHGYIDNGKNKTLDNAASIRTYFVLKQNYDFQNGLNVEGIESASFIIPELIDWLGIRTINWGATKKDELIAVENKLPPIVLKEANPHIEIFFEASNSLFNPDIDDRVSFEIINQPRIKIAYDNPEDVNRLISDIRGIMQFWGLMIGHITDVLDIRLDIKDQKMKSWLYINEDFSYNLRTQGIINNPRTKLKTTEENIQMYFENWYDFYYDNKFELIRRMYFEANKRKELNGEDILVQYVRILEGYHLRVTDEETVANTMEKEIKEMIFTEEGKNVFTPIFERADWKFNSKHAKDVAKWIASGFVLRTSLAQRLEQLDHLFFDIIQKNSEDIAMLEVIPLPPDYEIPEDFNIYQRIVATRNYYSHFKANKDKVLNFTQICNAINVLKALIIMILYTHMGMSNDDARKIIIWDNELHFQTMCLRQEGEKPTQG